jgi:hypothetical protein
MHIWARAPITGATIRLALFSVAAVATLIFAQDANSTAMIGIRFDGGAACLPGCTGFSGHIDFGAGAVSNHQGLVVNSDSGSTNFVVTNPDNQVGDLGFLFRFITDWHLDNPATEGDRATYSLSVEDAANRPLFSIAQTWTCGLLSGVDVIGDGAPCSALFDDILSFDLFVAPNSTNNIHVSFSAEADALSPLTVPEPVLIVLFATGLLGLLVARTRRRDWSAASS